MCKKENVLISFGDCIVPGLYKIHSRYANAINYVTANKLVSFVIKEIGNGPTNIVMDGLNFQKINSIKISEKNIDTGNNVFNLEDSKKYCSRISFTAVDISKFMRNLDFLEKYLLKNSPLKSYTFLLDDKKRENFVSSFERALINRVTEGWKEFVKNNYKKGVRLLRGTGYGSTPSGDDFIAGFISGLHLLHEIFQKNVSKVQKIIYKESKTNNIISNNYIYYSLRGCFFEKMKNLIISLVSGSESEIFYNTYKILLLGETSGADFITGFICSLKLK